jgi:hypothetical protein
MIQTITGFLPLIVLFVGFRILLKILGMVCKTPVFNENTAVTC